MAKTGPTTIPTSNGRRPSVDIPRERRATFGDVKVTSGGKFNTRTRKTSQVVTIDVPGGRQVVITLTPAGRKAKIAVDGQQVG